VKWDSNAGDGSENEVTSDSDGGWFSKLFGGRMLSNESNVEWTNSTGTILEELENVMVTSIWDTVLNDPNMSFNNDTKECAGLVVSEEDETDTNDDVNADFQAENSETKLLGLTIYPSDVVNPDGCINPSDQCTAIIGKMSATYSGTNEFGISNYIVNLLSEGMETGAFVSEGSPALMLDFVTMKDMSAGENSGIVVPIQTDRGTIWQVMQEAADDDAISKYGKLFVGLLVVLSVGFIVSSIFKKRRKDKRSAAEESEVTDDNLNGNQTVREEQISEDSQPVKETDVSEKEEQTEVAKEKSAAGGWAKFGNFFGMGESPQPQSVDAPVEKKEERPQSPVIDQVELDVPKSDSDEVEISLSNEPKKQSWW